MSRRPRRAGRRGSTTGARPVPGARQPAEPGSGRPVSSWWRDGSPGRTSACRGRASSSRRGPCCGATPERRSGSIEFGAVTLAEVRAAVAATHGYTFDTPRAAIDPDRTLAGRRARGAGSSTSRVAAGGSRSRPAGPRRCSPLHQELARPAQRAGGRRARARARPARSAPHGRGDRSPLVGRRCRGADRRRRAARRRGFEAPTSCCFAVGRVDLVVGDRGFAGGDARRRDRDRRARRSRRDRARGRGRARSAGHRRPAARDAAPRARTTALERLLDAFLAGRSA